METERLWSTKKRYWELTDGWSCALEQQSFFTSYLFILGCFVAEPLEIQVLVLMKEILKFILLGRRDKTKAEFRTLKDSMKRQEQCTKTLRVVSTKTYIIHQEEAAWGSLEWKAISATTEKQLCYNSSFYASLLQYTVDVTNIHWNIYSSLLCLWM